MKQAFRICLLVKLTDGTMSVKRRNLFVRNLQYYQFGQNGWKNKTF